MNFKKISLDMQSEYNSYLAECLWMTSDYSFINLWGWAEEHGLLWAWTDELVWIKQTIPVEVNWAPIGDWNRGDWKTLFRKYFKSSDTFIRVPSKLCSVWQEQGINFIVHESRGDWDYIYDLCELVKLKGKRFYKKKNRISSFRKQYEFKYLDFTHELVNQALDMQENWCEWRDCESLESLSSENRVISKILNAWSKLKKMTGGAIAIDKKLVAYTLAEYMDNGTILIHFEKGNTEYTGIYQAINQMFLDHLSTTEYTLVNRMQDLDDEGLRRAKLSYRPVKFLKKYRIVLE